MKKLPDNSIDLIIADPPYFEIVKEDWDNQWSNEQDYYNWCQQWIKECYRILSSVGSLYIWNWFNNICSIGYIAKQENFIIRNLITWCRGGGRETNNYRSQSEYLLYLTKNNKPIFNLNDILLDPYDECRRMTKQAWERGKYERKNRPNYNEEPSKPSNIWWDSFISKKSKENVGHPTQKPVDLCKYLINIYTKENEVVLDNCIGSGTIAIACLETNRKYIGFELNNTYYKKAQERINTYLNKINK